MIHCWALRILLWKNKILTMDGEETYDGEECASSGHPLELSQSSGVMSLPSGNKLADISITSDITDSEIENEDTVLGSHTFYELKKDSQCNADIANPTTANSELYSRVSTSQSNVTDRKFNSGRSDMENNAIEHIHSDKFLTNTVNSSSHSGDANRKVISDESYSAMPLPKYGEVPAVPSLSLDDIRFALQENSDLLSDQHLLNDLLKSLDEKISQDATTENTSCILSAQKYSHAFVPPNRDPGPSLGKKFRTNVDTVELGAAIYDISDVQSRCDSFSVHDFKVSVSDIPSQRLLMSDFHGNGPQETLRPHADLSIQNGQSNFVAISEQTNKGLLNSSISKKVSGSNHQEESVADKNSERHVKFHQLSNEDLIPSSLSRVGKHSSQQHYENHTNSLPCSAQSHKVLKQLSGLRWKLMGWEDVGTSPPSDKRSSLAFIHQLLNMLQAHQVEKKCLEDELLTAKSMLKKVSDEACIRQSLYEKREARLLEADTQLGVIQQEWVGAQETMQKEIMKLAAQCSELKEERELLKDESDFMKRDIMKLMQTAKEYDKLKVTIEEIQDQFAASRRQVADIAEENSRLNDYLQEKQRCLQELEEVKLPHVEQERTVYKNKAKGLEEAHNKLFLTKTHMEDDLRMLQEQHRVLLKKVVEEEEMKEKALKEKALLEDQVKNLSAQVKATRSELHQHYQAQVEDLVGKKSQSLQEQLNKLELNMKKNLEEQLDAQRNSHHHACLNLQKGHEKKIREIESSHATQIRKLQHHLMVIEEDNRKLQDQRQGIIAAVSSILGVHREDISITQDISKVPGREHHEEQLNSLRSKVSNRPTSGGSISQGKSPSKSGSRPASGKSTRGIPYLSIKSSSSSDSELSVFQEGGQTVRHLGVGSLDNVFFSTPLLENDSNVKPLTSRSVNVPGILGSNYHSMNSHPSNSEREYRSLPNLQSKSSVTDNHHGEPATVSWWQSSTSHLTNENDKSSVSPACDVMKINQESKGCQQDLLESIEPFLPQKIFKASEILQTSDNTDDDGVELPTSKQFQADQEMARILEELKMVKNNTKATYSEGPTHDTFDQDPASITLHKLSQVSTLLSQYVTQSH